MRGYSLVNLRAGIRALDGLLDVQLWGCNVLNAHYALTRSAANTYSPGVILGANGRRQLGVIATPAAITTRASQARSPSR